MTDKDPMTEKLLWADLETTGLDEQEHVILEVGLVITDKELNVLDSFTSPVYATSQELEKMNDYVRNMHTTSGLIEEVKTAPFLALIEDKVIEFIKKHFIEGDLPVLHGNTIHFDKKFIRKHMSKLDGFLHYRLIDVSTLKEILRKYSKIEEPKKSQCHRAIADIKESIAEYNKYMIALGLLPFK